MDWSEMAQNGCIRGMFSVGIFNRIEKVACWTMRKGMWILTFNNTRSDVRK